MLRRLLISVLLSLLAFAPAAQAARDFLVDADWLADEQANNPKLIVLEVRYHPHRYFTVGHIPGAIQVQRFKDLGDNDGRSIMLFPSQEDFQATLRRWGVNDDSTLGSTTTPVPPWPLGSTTCWGSTASIWRELRCSMAEPWNGAGSTI